MSKGLVQVSALHEKELSKLGQIVFKAISNLREGGDASTELSPAAIRVAACEVLGAERADVDRYLRRVMGAGAGAEAVDLLRTVREKTLLVEVLNEAGNQLATGRLDAARVGALVQDSDVGPAPLVSAADHLINGIPPEPHGVYLRSLPLLTEFSGGLMGMWAVASEPGIGKSTLAVQLALDFTRIGHVLYYDMENGEQVMLHRIGKVFNMDLQKTREATEKIFFRESVRTLDADLRALKGQECLIVIDSLQKLPTSVEFRRTSLDAWVHRFERLKKQGHSILLISEKNREQYGKATQAGFKETGEIEYSADFGFHLVPEDGMEGMLRCVVVKNRHRPNLGRACYLERTNGFKFVERV